ncbi:hypothetical protein EXIGLDRAFT_693190 [Exidia glandulosa HHB12029]|uniref:Uncharacterized protein n=1 Tax=Exidia glandulosa HHB12029 TaxID=1314781 RepID=A0A165HGW3_EXIGL|nr:hypothetical protein EXIGLDRAFT_693190 [Exidia glandulosa HHB12029]
MPELAFTTPILEEEETPTNEAIIVIRDHGSWSREAFAGRVLDIADEDGDNIAIMEIIHAFPTMHVNNATLWLYYLQDMRDRRSTPEDFIMDTFRYLDWFTALQDGKLHDLAPALLRLHPCSFDDLQRNEGSNEHGCEPTTRPVAGGSIGPHMQRNSHHSNLDSVLSRNGAQAHPWQISPDSPPHTEEIRCRPTNSTSLQKAKTNRLPTINIVVGNVSVEGKLRFRK